VSLKSLTTQQAIEKFKWPKIKPFQCEITPNFDCNARCIFCYSSPQLSTWQKRKGFSLQEIYKYLKKGKEKGAWICAISGGEVTIREDLFQIIAIAHHLKYPAIELTTNGIRLEDIDYCKKLVESGLNAVRFSLHSHLEKLHDKLIGRNGAWQSTIKAIENMIKLRVKVAINTVLIRPNYKFFPSLIDMLVDNYGIDSYSIVAPHYLGMLEERKEELSIRYSYILPFLLKGLEIIERKIKIVDSPILSNFLPCLLPSYYKNLIAEWELPKRDDLLILPQEGVKGIVTTKYYLSMKTEKCKECIYYKRCVGFEKSYYQLFGDDEFIPVKKEHRKYRIDTIYGNF